MLSLTNKNIEKAFFISPIVDMEKLITDMMVSENITEEELYKKKKIKTSFGETVSWDYLTFARKNPIEWNIPTYILYGKKDNMTSYEIILNFTNKSKANLTVMENGEHCTSTVYKSLLEAKLIKKLPFWVICTPKSFLKHLKIEVN